LKTIEILINAKGETTLETKGYAGSSCKAATKALEEALGVKSQEKLTAEYYTRQAAAQQLRQ
jgi:hypothetical protein